MIALAQPKPKPKPEPVRFRRGETVRVAWPGHVLHGRRGEVLWIEGTRVALRVEWGPRGDDHIFARVDIRRIEKGKRKGDRE